MHSPLLATPSATQPAARCGGLRRQPAGYGFTLVELLIALTVLALVTAGALPSLAEALERRRLAGVSLQTLALLQQARLEAQTRDEVLRVAVRGASGGLTCLLLHTGPAGSCGCEPAPATLDDSPTGPSGPDRFCAPGSELLRLVVASPAQGLRLSLNVASMSFDPSLGTTTPTGRVELRGRRTAIAHVVSVMGRVRRCMPAPSVGGPASVMAGIAAC